MKTFKFFKPSSCLKRALLKVVLQICCPLSNNFLLPEMSDDVAKIRFSQEQDPKELETRYKYEYKCKRS